MDAPLLALTRRRAWSGSVGNAFAVDTENMRQLIQLRWLAAFGQLLTILIVAYGLGVPLPVAPMLGIVAAAAGLNLVSMPILKRHAVTQLELLLALMYDVGLLTTQLFLSGGAANPFVSLYLLQVVLGAILLDWWAIWVIVVVTSLCFALLTIRNVPLTFPPGLADDAAGLFTLATWLCFALVATLLVLFVTRISRNLRLRDARLADLRHHAAEEEHFVRLGLFASGAAHELGTPLATLSVILGDWRRVPRLTQDRELAGEIDEMQAGVERCKAIVTDILHSAGELPGTMLEPVEVRHFLAQIAADWQALHPRTPLARPTPVPAGMALLADPSLRQAIWNILDNAAEASPDHVAMAAAVDEGMLSLRIADAGPGFSPAALAEVGKPQRSAKGSGHGVGLFLATSVVRKLDGSLVATNRAEGGAEVTVTLPVAPPATGGSRL